jgi:hypothetical protein
MSFCHWSFSFLKDFFSRDFSSSEICSGVSWPSFEGAGEVGATAPFFLSFLEIGISWTKKSLEILEILTFVHGSWNTREVG